MQYLENLDYDVVLLENGNMKVTETWDIYIKNTNTLFKTFQLDSTKYSGITNVKVSEIKDGRNIELTQINQEMYHVTKDCYYGLNINARKFEIAWGVGLDNSHDRRTYQVSYIIKDAITQYSDCQELYWQFLAVGENKIPAKKVTGNVYLPKAVKNIENLKIWGHGVSNGNIEKISNKQVMFTVNGLKKNERLEIRLVNTENIYNINNYNKIRNYSKLNTILSEEKSWAEETNNNLLRNILIIAIIYVIVFIIIFIKILIYRNKILKENKDIQKNLKYYRDIPRENISTPSEALYLYRYNKTKIHTSNAVGATILNLCLKNKITLRVENDKKVYIKVVENEEKLAKHELIIYKLLLKMGKKEFEVSELKNYAHKNYIKYSNDIEKFINETRNSLYNQKLIDKIEEKQYIKFKTADDNKNKIKNLYEWFVFNNLFIEIPIIKNYIIYYLSMNLIKNVWIILLAILPIIIEYIYLCNLKTKLRNRISVLTTKGQEEKAQWKGLYNYLKDYSLINEKQVTDLAIWEKYLVFATVFGISNIVLEQLKAQYPDVFAKESWDENSKLNKYSVLNYVANFDINDNINALDSISSICESAYRTAVHEKTINTSSNRGGGFSSGSGGGGGFSGGGGGGRRPEAGMGGR